MGVVHLIEARFVRLFHVDNHQAAFAVSNISVRARYVNVTRISQGNVSALDRMRALGLCQIDHFQAIVVDYEAIPELNRDGARMVESDPAHGFRIKWIVETYDYEFAIGGDVGVRARNRDVVRSGQCSFRIERPVRILRRIELTL